MSDYTAVLLPKLPFSGQLLIWSTRKWVQAAGQGSSLHETLRTAFRLARAPDAHVALDSFLSILFSANKRTVEFYNPKAVNVAPDEFRLLKLVAILQLGAHEDAAFALLDRWLPPAAQRHGMLCCNSLSQELLAGGHHFLPEEHLETPTPPTISGGEQPSQNSSVS